MRAKGVTLLRGQSRLGPEALGASRVPPPRGSQSQTHTAPGVSHLPLQLGFLASPHPAELLSRHLRAGQAYSHFPVRLSHSAVPGSHVLGRQQ